MNELQWVDGGSNDTAAAAADPGSYSADPRTRGSRDALPVTTFPVTPFPVTSFPVTLSPPRRFPPPSVTSSRADPLPVRHPFPYGATVTTSLPELEPAYIPYYNIIIF